MDIQLPINLKRSVMALGGDLKCRPACAARNTVRLFDEIGDLASPENQDALEQLMEGQVPESIVADLHPGYFSTNLASRMAHEKKIPLILVQHHRAHVAAVCLEHGLFAEPVIGLAFDGTGYGDDGSVWGGEFFTGSLAGGFARQAHFASLPVPGGDLAVRQPWRIVVALLHERGVPFEIIEKWMRTNGLPERDLGLFLAALKTGGNLGRSTALGRWFDAVSALLGIRLEAKFEAEPAIALQKAAEENLRSDALPWAIDLEYRENIIIDFGDLPELAVNLPNGPGYQALAFHQAAAEASFRVVQSLAERVDTDMVVLSGGCFFNALFTRLLIELLDRDGFICIRPQLLPPGDQALALGQIGLVLTQA